MSKTIAVQSTLPQIVVLLKQKGYKVIDMYEAQKPGASPDAFLYTTYNPDMTSGYHNGRDLCDIQLGSSATSHNYLTAIVTLNVTGMSPDAAVAALEYRLGQRRNTGH